MEQNSYSDEELTAYLDGEADSALRKGIKDAVSSKVGLSVRLRALEIDTGSIKSVFDDMLTQAPPFPVAFPRPHRRFRAVAFATLFSAVAGLAAGLHLQRANEQTWQHHAATYHALYVQETLSDVRETPAEADAILQVNAKRLGLAIERGRIANVAGLTLKRSQILGFEGQQILQIAYLSNKGTPVALCIKRGNSDANSSITSASMKGMASAVWEKGGYEYLLIGGTDMLGIEAAAQEFLDHL